MDNLIFKSFIPEFFLATSILFQLLCNNTITIRYKYNFPLIEKELFTQASFILVIVLLLLFKLQIEGVFFNSLFINDIAALNIKIIFIFSAFLLLNIIWQGYWFQTLNFFEFFTLFFFSILASMLLISCYDLLSSYLVLELQALCFYVLAGFKRNSTFSTEAALKYFITGSIFSCILLFGISLIYGALGTTNLYIIRLLAVTDFLGCYTNTYVLVTLGVLIIIVVIFFKLAIVPFHFWVPDVYDGAPLSTTIIFSGLPKIIIVTFLIRVLLYIPIHETILQSLFFTVGILSIVWGTLNALKQKRLKKLYIFSSITQIGFIALALGIFSQESISSIYFFLVIYTLTSVINWSALGSIYIFKKHELFYNFNKTFSIFLSDLSNLFKLNFVWSFIFLVIFFSMAGLPPFVGFLSKFYIFLALFISKNFFFAVFVLLLTSVSVFYYLRVLKIIYFEPLFLNKKITLFDASFNFLNKDFFCNIISFCIFLLVFLFFYPNSLIVFSNYISISLAIF